MGATARTVLALVSAVFVGFPAGWVLAMFCIPLFGWLEQVLHMELAGHSGPSNGVFYTAWILVIPALFFLFIRILPRPRGEQ